MAVSADWTQNDYNPAEHGFWQADTGEANFGYPTDYFFANTMQAIDVAFGHKFSNLYVTRRDEKGYVRKRIQVPIKFGPRAKSHDYRTELENAEIDENGIVDPKYYIQNPNLTWKFTNGSYDGTRQTSSDTIRAFYNKYLMSKGVELHTCDLLWQDQMVIPINIGIQLTANCDKDTDAEQIFEQVIAKTKDSVLFIYVKEFWFMNIRRDIKVKLESFEWNFGEEDLNEEAKREIKITFNFTCEAVIYRQIENSDIITSIVATVNTHINDTNIARIGVSGNAYMDSKYNSSAEYAAAASAKYFDGSLTSGYDFTNYGKHSVGLVSSLVDTIYTDLPYSACSAYETSAAWDASGYTLQYVYSAVPDTYRDYDRTYRLLDSTTYIFAKTSGIDIIDGQSACVINSAGTCINVKNNYVYPYTSYYTNGYEYGNKYLEDSKHNIINTVYATSHTTVSSIN